MSITYTKKTVTTAATPADMNDSNVNYLTRLSVKTAELRSLGKTDGITVPNYETHSVTRVWADEASANEWKSFIDNINVEFGFDSSTVISDI